MAINKQDFIAWLNNPTPPQLSWIKETNLKKVFIAVLSHIPDNHKIGREHDADCAAFFASAAGFLRGAITRERNYLSQILRFLGIVEKREIEAIQLAMQRHDAEEIQRARGEARLLFTLDLESLSQCAESESKPDKLPPDFLMALGASTSQVDDFANLNKFLESEIKEAANKARFGKIIADFRILEVMSHVQGENGDIGIALANAIKQQYSDPVLRQEWIKRLSTAAYDRTRTTYEIHEKCRAKRPTPETAFVFMNEFLGVAFAADEKKRAEPARPVTRSRESAEPARPLSRRATPARRGSSERKVADPDLNAAGLGLVPERKDPRKTVRQLSLDESVDAKQARPRVEEKKKPALTPEQTAQQEANRQEHKAKFFTEMKKYEASTGDAKRDAKIDDKQYVDSKIAEVVQAIDEVENKEAKRLGRGRDQYNRGFKYTKDDGSTGIRFFDHVGEEVRYKMDARIAWEEQIKEFKEYQKAKSRKRR